MLYDYDWMLISKLCVLIFSWFFFFNQLPSNPCFNLCYYLIAGVEMIPCGYSSADSYYTLQGRDQSEGWATPISGYVHRKKIVKTWRVSHYYSRIPMLIITFYVICHIYDYWYSLILIIDMVSTKSFDIIHIMWNSLVMTKLSISLVLIYLY